MLDGGPITDPLVHRALYVGRVCQGFNCLPSAAIRELENDPDQLAMLVLDLRGYEMAKRAFDRATDKVDGLKAWQGDPYMTLVETFTFESRQAAQEGAEGDGR